MSEKDAAVLAREKWDELFRSLKKQWEAMWLERYDDRVKAEGVARQDYSLLFVSRGTVVAATRRCRAPDFVEILEQQRKLSGVEPSGGYANPSVGGWGRFIRSTLGTRSRLSRRRSFAAPAPQAKGTAQKKKGGRSWLHA